MEKFQNWTPALVFVYVLTHPGSPCIFASKIPDIFGLPDESVLPQERELAKDLLTQEQINDLMEVRRRNDIKAAGTVQNVASEKDLYCALINAACLSRLARASSYHETFSSLRAGNNSNSSICAALDTNGRFGKSRTKRVMRLSTLRPFRRWKRRLRRFLLLLWRKAARRWTIFSRRQKN